MAGNGKPRGRAAVALELRELAGSASSLAMRARRPLVTARDSRLREAIADLHYAAQTIMDVAVGVELGTSAGRLYRRRPGAASDPYPLLMGLVDDPFPQERHPAAARGDRLGVGDLAQHRTMRERAAATIREPVVAADQLHAGALTPEAVGDRHCPRCNGLMCEEGCTGLRVDRPSHRVS